MKRTSDLKHLISRRDFLLKGASKLALSTAVASAAEASSLHCTPAPSFPIPLEVGTWRSPGFPVGKHDYHVWLYVDRRLPLEKLDCDLGPPRPGNHCDTPPLLDVKWKVWDGGTQVKSWPAKPIKAASWAQTETGCFLGNFEGKRNGTFTLEWNVRRDPGALRALHPRIEIVKNPGYWCWL